MNPIYPTGQLILGLVLILALAAALSWVSAVEMPRRRAFAAALCRVLGLCALAAPAFNWGFWSSQTHEERSEWMVLMDSSASMETVEPDSAESRLQQAVGIWQDLQGATESIQAFAFSDGIEAQVTKGETTLSLFPDPEHGTNLVRTLEALRSYYADPAQLRGVIILSDGRQSPDGVGANASSWLQAHDIPLYAVALGGEVVTQDLHLFAPQRHYTSFSEQSLVLKVKLRNQALGGVRPEVRLLDARGKVLESKRVNVANNSEAEVEFEVLSPGLGYHEYEVVTDILEQDKPGNNRATISAIVLDGELNVLLAEGLPHWDSKFLAQLIRKQSYMRLTTLHRVTEKRFFRVDPESSQARESDNSTVFPDSIQELSKYNLVILGRGVDYFLGEHEAQLLEEFVSQHGGSVIYARGKPVSNAFDALDSLSPVVWGVTQDERVRWQPTVAGESNGLFGQTLPGREDPLWERLPTIVGTRSIPALNSFSQVLVDGTVTGSDQVVPLVVSRRVGKGLVTAINGEGFWQWDFFPKAEEAGAFYQDFWLQLIQWSATFSDFLPGHNYSLGLSSTRVKAGYPVRVAVNARDSSLPKPQVVLKRGDVESSLHLRSKRDGGWEAVFIPKESGSLRVEMQAHLDSGQENLFAALEVEPPPSEMDNLNADSEFLAQLTSETGGRLLTADEAYDLVNGKEEVREVSTQQGAVWHPQWDKLWLALLAVGFFGLEWTIRRRNGLI